MSEAEVEYRTSIADFMREITSSREFAKGDGDNPFILANLLILKLAGMVEHKNSESAAAFLSWDAMAFGLYLAKRHPELAARMLDHADIRFGGEENTLALATDLMVDMLEETEG